MKLFNINGQKFKSEYVDSIKYLSPFEYGYVTIKLTSGSKVNLPNEEAFIGFLYKQDWFTPVEVM